MRTLCNTIVEKRFGVQSPSTAIVKTALDLWDDPHLVGALQNNPTYRSARERIHRTASHILAGSIDIEESGTQSPSKSILHSTHEAIKSPFEHVLQCNVCGLKLQCLHKHDVNCKTPVVASVVSETTKFEEQDVEEFGKFTEGTVGRVPDDLQKEDMKMTTTPIIKSPLDAEPFNWDLWFGPLVLATLAAFGIVVGVWIGDIALPRMKSVTSRAVVAVTMMMQASDSLFNLLRSV